MEPKAINKCGAEFIATFALTFIGAGSIIASQFSGIGLLGIALAHGITLAIMVSATMNISGGNVNPAVTMGLLVTKRISPLLGIMYIVAQCLGAVAAAFVLSQAFDSSVWQPSHLGTPDTSNGFTAMAAFKLETILTFFLVFVVFGTAVDSRAPKIGGLAIGATIAADILMGGALSGASMNPARSFGPALISGHWHAHWAYWAGPLLGGALAGLIYDKFVSKTE